MLSSIKKTSVLFATGDLHDEASGPYHSLMQTAAILDERGHDITVIGTVKNNIQPVQPLFDIQAFQRYGPSSMHYAPKIERWLEDNACNWDLASLEGVWLYLNKNVADHCIKHKKPFILSTHGNFNTVALKISFWKKWLAKNTYMRSVFSNVKCYHALSYVEYKTLRNYGITKPIAIIGNGVNFPDFNQDNDIDILPKVINGRKVCLYLGRLHPIKGIDRLIRAWSRLKQSNEWLLVIAGNGDKKYECKLKKIVNDNKCQNIEFIGFVSGDIKTAWLRVAKFSVLPSHSEAFPVSLLESFSHGVPALFTTTCGLPESVEAGAAIEVESNENSIQLGLITMLNLSDIEMKEMGNIALDYTRNNFSWPIISQQLEDVYGWMLGDNPAPKCLMLK